MLSAKDIDKAVVMLLTNSTLAEKNSPSRSTTLITLSLLAGLPALSVDICLAAMPDIGRDLAQTASGAEGVIAFFAIAFGVGQLFSGVISDRFGRRNPILIALAVYVLASILGSFAPSLATLYLARIVQGFAASMGVVGFVSIARDCFSGKELAQILATVGSIAALAPISAPILGAQLHLAFGWRMSILFLGLYGVVVAGWVFWKCHETHHQRISESVLESVKQFLSILRHGPFLRYASIHSFGFCCLFAYLISGSMLMIEVQGVTPTVFSLWFSSNAVVFCLTNWTASRIVRNISLDIVLSVGACCLVAGAGMMFLWSETKEPWAFCLPMYLATVGVGLILPMSSAGAMQQFATKAGRAAALLGFLRFFIASIFTHGMSTIESVEPIGLLILGCGSWCLLLAFLPKVWRVRSWLLNTSLMR